MLKNSSLLFLLFAFLLQSCSKEISPLVLDKIHQNGWNQRLKQADLLKYEQNYPAARLAFQAILTKSDLTKVEYDYAFNQLIFCELSMNEDSLVNYSLTQYELKNDTSLLNSFNKADFFYNKGLNEYRNGTETANIWFDKALQYYKQEYTENHLKLGYAYTQLAMWHFEYGRSLLVFKNYLNLAQEVFYQNNTKQHIYSYFYLAKAMLFKMERSDNEISENCELGKIRIRKNTNYFDDVLYARILILQNFSYRLTAARKYTSDSINRRLFFQKSEDTINKAILLLNSKKHLRIHEALSNKASVYQNISQFENNNENKSNFWNTIKELESVINSHQKIKFAYPNLIKGYYLYQNEDKQMDMMKYLNLAIKEIEESKWNKTNSIDLVFALFKEHYRKRSDFKKALYTNAQELCFLANIPFDLNAIYSDKVKYGDYYQSIAYKHRGDIYWEYYNSNKKVKNLLMAKFCYEIADTLLFTTTLNNDLDVVLNLQNEIGESLYENVLKVCYELWNKNHNKMIIENAFRYIERQKAFFLTKEIGLEKFTSENKELRNLYVEQEKLRQKSLNFEQLEKIKTKIAEYNNNFKTQNIKLYDSLIIQELPNISNIQKKLDKEEAVLELKSFKNDLYLVLIEKNNVRFIKRNFSIHHQKSMDNIIFNVNSNSFNVRDYNLVYELLFKDIEHLWLKEKKINKLCIIPDKQFNLIPFDALMIKNEEDDKHFLVNYLAISISPSYKVWDINKNFQVSEQPKAVFFSYSERINNPFSLPSSHFELYSLKKFTHDVTIFDKTSCSSGNFLKLVKNYEIVHLSLHAQSNSSKLDSNIVYFSIKDNKLSDPLFSFEVNTIKTKNSLLILSACETAKGNKDFSEGIFSLTRSFYFSGFSNIIASLWKIEDKETSEIINNFYIYLSKKKNVTLALQKAKVTFIKNNPLKRNPYYWASIILNT